MKKKVNHQFKPIIENTSEILILGSFPSVKSRVYSFYYMHPMNRFWKLLSMIYHEDFTTSDISLKTELLLKHKVAIYDVIESCNIEGSSDSTISNVIPVDIEKLIQNTNISRIFLNGKKAYKLFVKYNSNLSELARYLPSTSPANARFSIDKLYNKWEIIKKTS